MSPASKPQFVGNHRRSLDSKNRLTIPSIWRFDGDTKESGSETGLKTLAIPDPKGCIVVLPPFQVSKIYDDITNRSIPEEEIRQYRDVLLPQAAEIGCDKQGRIMLPQYFLELVEIKKDAVLVGSLTNYRIWSPKRWAEVEASNKALLGQVINRAIF